MYEQCMSRFVDNIRTKQGKQIHPKISPAMKFRRKGQSSCKDSKCKFELRITISLFQERPILNGITFLKRLKYKFSM